MMEEPQEQPIEPMHLHPVEVRTYRLVARIDQLEGRIDETLEHMDSVARRMDRLIDRMDRLILATWIVGGATVVAVGAMAATLFL